MTLRTAALRHHRDARYLHEDHRNENADQLYGLAAECALKAALVDGFGLPPGTGPGAYEPGERRHRLHLNQGLWELALGYLTGRVGARFHNLLGQDRPFWDWTIEQRYQPAPVSAAVLDRHAKGAGRAMRALDEAVLMGYIR